MAFAKTADGTPLEFEFITIADNVEEVKSGQMIASDCAASRDKESTNVNHGQRRSI